MAEKAVSTYSYKDYLEIEASSETKYEFHGGMIVSMAGGTPEHGLIALNVGTALNIELRNKKSPCSVFGSDVKIHIDVTKRTFYPDGSVVCGKHEISEKDEHAIINPVLIIEVLSDSTADFDRGAKFGHYRQIPSLRQYILISQKEILVDSFYLTENGTWEIQTLTNPEEEFLLKSIDCSISVKEIYLRVPGLDPAFS